MHQCVCTYLDFDIFYHNWRILGRYPDSQVALDHVILCCNEDPLKITVIEPHEPLESCLT